MLATIKKYRKIYIINKLVYQKLVEKYFKKCIKKYNKYLNYYKICFKKISKTQQTVHDPLLSCALFVYLLFINYSYSLILHCQYI